MVDERAVEKKRAKQSAKKFKKEIAEKRARGVDNVHVQVARHVDPKKKYKHEPTIDKAIMPRGAIPTLAEYMRDNGKTAPDNFLDNMILSMGNSNVPLTEIAELTNLTVTEVDQRYKTLLKTNNNFSSADMRLMMTQQLRDILNWMHNAAKAGSTEHTKMALQAIERLNKMYELELQQTKITVELITNEQTTLLTGLVQLIVDKVMASPEISKHVAPEIIDGVVISVFDEATEFINSASAKQLTA